MPRRYARYEPEFQGLHQLSTAGSMILGVGLVMCAIVLIYALFRGKRTPANPWGGASLEWQCSSPPPLENFAHPPTAGDPYDFSKVVFDEQTGGYVPREADLPATEPRRAEEEPALV